MSAILQGGTVGDRSDATLRPVPSIKPKKDIQMRKILGAVLALGLMISAIPAQAGCFGGLFGGRQARQQARMMAATGGCSTSSVSTYSTAISTAPGFTAVSCSTCPSGYAYVPNNQLATYYSTTPALAPAPAPIVRGSTCDANGDGCCDACGHNCRAATAAPPPLSETTTDREVITNMMEPIAPPIAYTPKSAFPPPIKIDKGAYTPETIVAFR